MTPWRRFRRQRVILAFNVMFERRSKFQRQPHDISSGEVGRTADLFHRLPLRGKALGFGNLRRCHSGRNRVAAVAHENLGVLG
jgi:hypothetical protein